MKIRKSLVVGCLVSLLGIGAAVGAAASADKAPAKEAKAVSASGTRVYLNDQGGKDFTYYGGDPHAYMTSITFTSGSGYTSVSQVKADAFGGSITKGSNYLDVAMQWVNDDSDRPYAIVVPWYIASFTVEFRQFGNTNALYEKGNDDPYTINCVAGKEYKLYSGNYSGYGSWWDGSKYRTAVSLVTNNDYSYDENQYTVTVSKTGTGSVSPSSGSYKKNQILTLSATPSEGWSFGGWSDSGAQSHSIYVTATTTYTATFLQLPALATPSLTLESDNRVTWTAVANAQSYKYTIDGGSAVTVATTATLEVPASLVPGTHNVEVWAVGNNTQYVDSAHATQQYTVPNGYFLFGSYTTPTWGRVGASEMAATGTANEYEIASVNLPANAEVKAVYYSTGGNTDYFNAESLEVSQETQTEYPVSITDGYKNIKVGAAGHYKIRVNTSTKKYIVTALDYSAGYVVTIGGTPHDMVYNSGNEYKVLGVSVTAGQSIAVSRKGAAIADVSAKPIYNNDVKSDLTVYFSNASADVYYDTVTKKIWMSFPADPGFHIVKNGNQLIEMTAGEEYDGFMQYYSDSINFSANDTLQFINASTGRGENLPELFNITTNDPGSTYGEDYFAAVAGVMTCKKAASTKVYLKLKQNYDRVYFGAEDPEVADAKVFAKNFVDAIGTEKGVCKADGSTNLTALGTAWGLQVDAFDDLTEAAQNVLKNAVKTESSVAEIRSCISVYRVVLERYDDEVLGEDYDFLASGIKPSGAASILPLLTKEADTTVVVLIAVAAVSIAGVGAFFFIKRRKEDR